MSISLLWRSMMGQTNVNTAPALMPGSTVKVGNVEKIIAMVYQLRGEQGWRYLLVTAKAQGIKPTILRDRLKEDADATRHFLTIHGNPPIIPCCYAEMELPRQ